MTVTFFGHRNAPKEIEAKICTTLEELIARGAEKFYVGNNGDFDYMVLEKLPDNRDKFTDYSISIYPEEIDGAPPRFAIDRRNKWMVDNSDCVVTYVNRGYGGAAKFKEYAEKRGKTVINLE